jgi:mono/diheme cytochrome c family protein
MMKGVFAMMKRVFGVLVLAALLLLLTLAPAAAQPASGGGQSTTVPLHDLKNPIPMSATSVAAGRALFQTNCVVCHGADARGDGPMAQTLNPRPADLTASHVDIHTDGDLYGWIKNGYPGSAMPGFGGKLSDDQIWQLVNYIRSLRHPIQGTGP